MDRPPLPISPKAPMMRRRTGVRRMVRHLRATVCIGALVGWAALASMAHAQQVTPRAGSNYTIGTGGTAITLIAGPTNGCYIFNPLTAADQGIMTAEPYYVDPTTTATTTGNATNTAIAPGQGWFCIPNSTLPVSGNAATTGHIVSMVRW